MRLNASGGCRTEEIRSAKDFFCEQFPQLQQPQLQDLSDIQIQRHLLALVRSGNSQTACRMAQLCLRCFISHQILRVCQQLSVRFGRERGFTDRDLLPLVLDDVLPSVNSKGSYRSVADNILQTFEPERAGLSTWTARLVKRHPELTRFLLERGIYTITDWAILNDTKLTQLRRILADFYDLSTVEVQNNCNLLECYHKVYRAQRIEQRLARGKVSSCCPPPDRLQLENIAARLDREYRWRRSPKQIRELLQELAGRLRQYRIYVRGGTIESESLDAPEMSARVGAMSAREVEEDRGDRDTFLSAYRDDFEGCLDRAVRESIQARLSRKPRKNSPTPEQFLTALHMFHCEGKSMSEIARVLGFKAQYQVTRMLKLKDFRADVRQQMLVKLLDRVLERAKVYVDREQLAATESQVKGALDEQIETEIEQAEKEASVPHDRPVKSLFSRRLCHYLQEIEVCQPDRCEC
ncbi:MAG: hypothetical protein SWY16_22215 [Cyanobacteriota bacterium]|nr:hypothetical protein [Cyanobacteriota bacterium]